MQPIGAGNAVGDITSGPRWRPTLGEEMRQVLQERGQQVSSHEEWQWLHGLGNHCNQMLLTHKCNVGCLPKTIF